MSPSPHYKLLGKTSGDLKIIDTASQPGWMVAMCKCGKRRAVNMKQFERGEHTACIACEKWRRMQSLDSQ
jgi:hypothetical protein